MIKSRRVHSKAILILISVLSIGCVSSLGDDAIIVEKSKYYRPKWLNLVGKGLNREGDKLLAVVAKERIRNISLGLKQVQYLARIQPIEILSKEVIHVLDKQTEQSHLNELASYISFSLKDDLSELIVVSDIYYESSVVQLGDGKEVNESTVYVLLSLPTKAVSSSLSRLARRIAEMYLFEERELVDGFLGTFSL